MIVTRLKLTNWRNFQDVDVPLQEINFILGANAAGKSNFLDVFRFLRDVSKPQGGGLQKALKDRGGISKVRCLHARRNTQVQIEVHLADDQDSQKPDWIYILAFKPEGTGTHRTLISSEKVFHKGKWLIDRPHKDDTKDPTLLVQSYLEQNYANKMFRGLAEFFSETLYLHLVPQLLKYSDQIGGRLIEDDPFGQGFLERLAKSSEKVRDSRLRKIEKALSVAIPQFEKLKFERDKITGRPHLSARYVHHRPNAGWQREDHFSDGTLRLIGLLWSLLEGGSLLLLEEPELSLNDEIVEQIPLMLHRILRESKRKPQVIISTHSKALLSNKGIDPKGVLLIEPKNEGSSIRTILDAEKLALSSGFSIAETVLPKTRPRNPEQLVFAL